MRLFRRIENALLGRAVSASFPLLIALFLAGSANALDPTQGRWIWVEDEGAPNPSKVWLRKEVKASEPSTGVIRLAGDQRFTLWVNGVKIGSGGADKPVRFNLNGIVGRGANVIAIEAERGSGPGGVFVLGDIRSQSGHSIPFASDASWKGTTKPPAASWIEPRFDTSLWTRVHVLSPKSDSAWSKLDFSDSYLDRFTLAPGLEIERIAEPELIGGAIAITWGNRGRIMVARERTSIISLIDENGDGKFEKKVEYTNLVKNCQGLCTVGDDLYAVGEGSKGPGLYRLPDANHDDRADSVIHLCSFKGGMGEHGPHDIVLGPDGHLYVNLGNHAWVKQPAEPTTPARNWEEGFLLNPPFEDANGHAVGIKAPGGTVWRLSDDAKRFWAISAGFRNHYDFAFNKSGDIFTFDSDMEWDVGTPWYRPVRVNHCVPGAEFGWRSGASCWPPYYFDSLPAAVDIGRGSPTGVIFYEHVHLPAPYRGSFLSCDWSMGRILAVKLNRQGASFGGAYETLISGNPLNVSDIEVDRDGTIVFSTGGRSTEGGLYRIKATGVPLKRSQANTLEALLDSPQIQAAWAREDAAKVKKESGDRWRQTLEQAARDGSAERRIRALTLLRQFGPAPDVSLLLAVSKADDPAARAFATWLLGDHSSPEVAQRLGELLGDVDPVVRRRACEAFVLSGQTAAPASLIKLLASRDHFERFAARLALERVPSAQWRDAVLGSDDPRVVTNGLLALSRLGKESLPAREALERERALLARSSDLGADDLLELVRMIQLSLIAGGKGPATAEIGKILLSQFPSVHEPLNREIARVIAVLNVPGAIGPLMDRLTKSADQASQIHYALVLRYLDVGWTLDHKRRLLDWYDTTDGWEGGDSFVPFLNNILGATLAKYTPADRKSVLDDWSRRPFATRLVLQNSSPEQIEGFDQVVSNIADQASRQPKLDRSGKLMSVVIEALGKRGTESCLAQLRALYEAVPDERNLIARKLADHPRPAHSATLVRALDTDDQGTLRVILKALPQIDQRFDSAADIRRVILAGLRLGGPGQALAVNVLRHWAGADQLAYYQEQYRQRFPNAPAPELAKAPAVVSKYSLTQLQSLIEREERNQTGDERRGQKAFAKANCVKCHRFQLEGQGVGPDLTSIRRRFQRKEILDSILHPSQVISDQYKSVTVVTKDGLVSSGMALPTPKTDVVTLLLPTANKVEIPKSDIEEIKDSKVSVMPEGLLNELSLEEIADLFALLETSKYSDAPAPQASPSASLPTQQNSSTGTTAGTSSGGR